jgi:folylpolyglutamate synthase/dihydropteroate synthase
LIFGASADKDIEGMLTELLPRVSTLIVTRAEHPRAEEPERLAAIGHSHGVAVEQFEDTETALAFALQNAGEEDVILVAGSIFVAGQVLSAWQAMQMASPQNQED